MTSPQYSHHFSINNLPFGVASSATHPDPRCVTRLENTVIFLADLQAAGVFADVNDLPKGVFGKSTLNRFATLPKRVLRHFRSALQEKLKLLDLLPENSTEDISAVEMHLPVSVGDFTGISRFFLLFPLFELIIFFFFLTRLVISFDIRLINAQISRAACTT